MKLLLNLLTVPFKLVLLPPVVVVGLILLLAGEDYYSCEVASIIFEPWF